MQILITRPTFTTGKDGLRIFAPGITVDVDAATAKEIIDSQSGISVDAAGRADTASAQPPAPRRKKAADADA